MRRARLVRALAEERYADLVSQIELVEPQAWLLLETVLKLRDHGLGIHLCEDGAERAHLVRVRLTVRRGCGCGLGLEQSARTVSRCCRPIAPKSPAAKSASVPSVRSTYLRLASSPSMPIAMRFIFAQARLGRVVRSASARSDDVFPAHPATSSSSIAFSNLAATSSQAEQRSVDWPILSKNSWASNVSPFGACRRFGRMAAANCSSASANALSVWRCRSSCSGVISSFDMTPATATCAATSSSAHESRAERISAQRRQRAGSTHRTTLESSLKSIASRIFAGRQVQRTI